jgi:hypothetical protein
LCHFLDDVLRGLSARRKTLPSKYFYDAEGSRLFEAICELPEYYLTRTETALLVDIAPELAAFVADDAALVEFGSGASVPALPGSVTIEVRHLSASKSRGALPMNTWTNLLMACGIDVTRIARRSSGRPDWLVRRPRSWPGPRRREEHQQPWCNW